MQPVIIFYFLHIFKGIFYKICIGIYSTGMVVSKEDAAEHLQ